MAHPTDLATPHDTPIPITAARMDYLGAVASGECTDDELEWLRQQADEADAEIAALATAPVEPWNPPTPTSLETWLPYIPEHLDPTGSPAPGGHCTCPSVVGIVLHTEGCAQGASGKAQPYDEATCAEYDLGTNELVDAVSLGAALRAITTSGLADVMLWEAEDREFVAVLQRDQTPEELEVRAANVKAYLTDSAVRAKFDRDEAEREEAESEAEYHFETLRRRMTVEDYDRMFMELDVDDPDAVLSRLRAEVAALPAVASTASVPPAAPFTVPPAPGAATPHATAAPLPPVAHAAPLSAEQATLAEALRERAVEAAHLQLELEAYLSMLPADDAGREVGALMAMTLAERSEAVEAARSGRLHRLGLKCNDLLPSAPNSRQAWIRLREGAAGAWSMSDLTPMSDAQLDAVLNRETPPPVWLNLFYDRGQHVLAGPGGCGKTWVALAICKAAVPAIKIPGGETGPFAVYLDLDQNYELHRRLRDLGLGREAMRAHDVAAIDVASYAAERGEGVIAALRAILDGLVKRPPRVVVLDSLTRIIAETDGDGSNNGDAITRALNMLNALSKVSCVIVLDHTGHENPDRPAGAGAKINTSRAVLTMKPLASDSEEYPNTIASAVVVQTKDRDGGLRQHLAPGNREPRPELGMLVVDRDEAQGGRTEVRFIPAYTVAAAKERRESDAGVAVAHEAHDAILTAVKGAAEPMSQRAIEDTVWPEFAQRKGFTKTDFRAVVRHMIQESKELVEDGSGRGGGKRYTVK
ncbi:hypothetical protein AXK57_19675 [Tsukamurella pulmonis]|uniref:AAA family ATPase n=1 Tax=Tsukamurella pulmonis TaxID=47312 RepID=UPI0007977468|nr:AAA family ATPase [Tsukamurella pulmonis]KXP12501.1 hypothetical protein AXK57_19675 [Tsukamurella pulmonis]